MIKKTLIFSILLVAVVTLTTSCSKAKKQEVKKEVKQEIKKDANSETQAAEAVDPLIVKKAADFELVNLEGKKVTLADYKGKTVMLNFWATWCPPCKKEIPDFINMYSKYKEKGLVFVGIAGFKENIDKIKTFVKEKGINYPILFVEPDAIKPLTESYGGIRGIPSTFLIDKEGIIRSKWVGSRTEEQFMEEISKYINK